MFFKLAATNISSIKKTKADYVYISMIAVTTTVTIENNLS